MRDKDSSIVIIDKKDYVNKFEERIRKGIYETTTDAILDDLRKF